MSPRTSVARWPRALIATLLLVSGASSCKLTEPDGKPNALFELAARRNQWAQKNIHSYAFDYDAQGFAVFPPVRIEVLDDEVYRVTNRTTGVVFTEKVGFPTIDRLFETAASVLSNDMYDAHIDYDGQFGYPTRIDAASQVPDAGFTERAGNFTRLTFDNLVSALRRGR
jgi:hypothetical protein